MMCVCVYMHLKIVRARQEPAAVDNKTRRIVRASRARSQDCCNGGILRGSGRPLHRARIGRTRTRK